MLQGVTLGLCLSTIPFVLKTRGSVTFASLGVLGLAGYPYSLKIAWSPFVDAYHLPGVGLRKSWIIVTQLLISLLLYVLGSHIDEWISLDPLPLFGLTCFLVLLAFVTATQDVAVDGWAIDLLTGPARGYASNCQSVGLSIGFFFSHTVLLALSSGDFCRDYLWWAVSPSNVGEPLLSVASFSHAWSLITLLLTLIVALIHEHPPAEPPQGALAVFVEMKSVATRSHMVELIAFLLLFRVPFGIEAVTPLKMLDKGLRQEDVAVASLINVPFDILFGYAAARIAAFSRGGHALMLLRRSVLARLALLPISALLVYAYPLASPSASLAAVVAVRLVSSAVNVVGFVALGAFFAQIADPAIGATFMTLLQTFANLGGSWPQSAAMQAVHWMTVRDETGGVVVDGYFVVIAASILLGAAVTVPYTRRVSRRLENIHPDDWKR